MRSHLLNKKFIFADEITVQVRQEQDQSSQSKSYMWVYRSGEFVEQPIAIYDYQPSKLSSTCYRRKFRDDVSYQ